MSTVYIIGAGASRGESLTKRYPEAQPLPPPLINGFFNGTLLNNLGYSQAQRDLSEVIAYVQQTKLLTARFGEGQWEYLDLEELFTAIEVEREFQPPESDEGARFLILRNSLVRYIRRILGLCTVGARGNYYHSLVEKLAVDDSIITFNWDLLLDQEFISDEGRAFGQYANFPHRVPLSSGTDDLLVRFIQGDGLLLKLHGSLNWFRCVNPKCQANSSLSLFNQPQLCLDWNRGDEGLTCWHCGSLMNPVIIPPLLRKPIAEDPVIRTAWGLARERLIDCSKVIVIGFSAAPTDFYSSWLLRSTVEARKDVEIEVINPCNGEDRDGHREFKRRMELIFMRGYGSKMLEFSQIVSILDDPDKLGTVVGADT